MEITKREFVSLAMDLGRLCRSGVQVRAARRNDGSVYAFPCNERRSDWGDETLAYFDFRTEDGEGEAQRFLASITIGEE